MITIERLNRAKCNSPDRIKEMISGLEALADVLNEHDLFPLFSPDEIRRLLERIELYDGHLREELDNIS
jgi:dsDNA-specific endonuclease/ATPase MutS2